MHQTVFGGEITDVLSDAKPIECILHGEAFIIKYKIDTGDQPTCLVGRPTRWSLLFIFGFLFWSSSWCLQPNIGVSFSVWPLPRAGMVVLDQFFSKMYFLYIWRSPPKNLTEFWGGLAPQNKVYFRALSVSQKMWMSRPHVGKYRWILYDISYELIINCNESTMIILSDLMKGTCFQTNACK